MSELFWLPISLLVVISAVPLGKQEFDLNIRKDPLGAAHSNEPPVTPVRNPTFYSDDPGITDDSSTQTLLIKIDGEDVRNSTELKEFIINATENSVHFRRLKSWIFMTYQVFKNESVDFHSPSFVSDLKRHISRSTLSKGRDGSKQFSYRKLFLRSEKLQSLHVYKHRKNQGSQFAPIHKMYKYGKKGFRSTTPESQNTDVDDRKLSQSMFCEHVSGYNTVRWLEMVVLCPVNWTESSVKFKCESWNNLVLPSFSFLPFLPVQDAQGRVYANVFCAKCHGIDNILPWTSKIVCDKDGQIGSLDIINIASTTVLNQFLRTPVCKRQVIPSLPDDIVPCGMHSPDKNARKCTTPVCDVINSDYPVSFNVLMNFDFTGDTHLLFSASPRLTEEYIPRCREWETFDTYSQTCRPITCNKYYTLVGDRCLPTQHDSALSDGITDPQELRSVDQTALVSLVLNVTYNDYLNFVLNNNSDVNIVHQLADKLNISAERIKDVNVTFEFSSANGTALKVTTLTEEQYNRIFPPMIHLPDSTTEIPKQTEGSSTPRNRNRVFVNGRNKTNSTDAKLHGNTVDSKQSKNKSFLDQKAIFSRSVHGSGGGSKGEAIRRDAEDITRNFSDQAETADSNEHISITETGKKIETTRESFAERKLFSKYVEEFKRADLFSNDFSRGPGFRKLRIKDKDWNDVSGKGLDVELVAKNGTTYMYVSEPYNNKSDRIVLQAEDIAAAAFMTGFEILDVLLKQMITMRVSFVLVPPHDPHSNEDDLNALLQKINTMIIQKQFSIKLNGNDVDVIDEDDKSDIVAEAEGFCPMGRDALFFDDEFVLVNVNNQTLMYINNTDSYIPVGRFDLWVVFAGNLAHNETSVTGLSKCAFVCFMPRILETDCNRIDLESKEYFVIESNRSIIFEETEYDFYSYRVVNESTGKIQICVPQSFHNNMQTKLPHIKFYGGCSRDFNTALKVEGYMTLVLGRISIAALACVLITYCLFPRLRNLPGINTMNLTFALLVAEVIFSEGIDVSTHWLCSAVAISIHFTFLASHFWMNVMSYDLYRTFANSQSTIPQLRDRRRYFPRYAAYAWGVPMLIVGLCAFIDFSDLIENVSIGYGKVELQDTNITDYDIITTQDGDISIQDIRNATGDLSFNIGTTSICWITKPLAALVSFGAPILLIFSVNCAFFAKTILSISKTMKLTKRSITSKHSNSSFQTMSGRSDVMLYVKMSTVMGFTWIFGLSSSILSSFAKPITYSACIASHFLAICFTLFNASQGVFIFIAFVCNRRVLALYCSLFRRVRRFVLRKNTDTRLSSVSTIESNKNAPASYTNRI